MVGVSIAVEENSAYYIPINHKNSEDNKRVNDQLKEARGGDFRLNLLGVDELSIAHNSVMFEACCTSFQMHLQMKRFAFLTNCNSSSFVVIFARPILFYFLVNQVIISISPTLYSSKTAEK